MIELISSMVPQDIAAHAPALLVVAPMLLAPIAAFMPNGRLAWILAILATGISLIMAMSLVDQVRSIEGGAVLSYAMGGWAPDAGIEFRIDSLNSMVLLLVSTIGFLAAIFMFTRLNVKLTGVYMVLTAGVWLGVMFSGIHATLAGILAVES